ncbi:hypothetical protein FRB90_001504 [Tulasnella sp. 427]|nr:hypothetical protein FRB90_001504 [Tulasnella sp. 427]
MELSLLNLLASTALGHVKRAAAAGWKLDERRDIISAGAYAINAVDTATGTAGKAFSLVIFQAILLIWDSLSEEEREEQMSETLIKATKHILLHITVIFNKCGAPTLTEALHSEIRIKTHLEEFHLPPMKLAAFIADIVNGKPGLCKSVGIECVLPAADRLLKDRCLWEYL